LYAIDVVDYRKDSCSDYRFPIENRINKIGRNRIASRNWWWRKSIAPNRHGTITMSFNLLSSINHIVDVAKRKCSVILIGDHREIGRFCYQETRDRPVAFAISAMAGRATRLIFYLADVGLLTHRLLTKTLRIGAS